MEKQTNIPALRFPEFKGEWEKKKLGEVAEKIMYGMNSAAIEFDGVNKYLRITDIDESSREFLPKPLAPGRVVDRASNNQICQELNNQVCVHFYKYRVGIQNRTCFWAKSWVIFS